MEKVKWVFAFLGLVWVIEILSQLIFPRTWGPGTYSARTFGITWGARCQGGEKGNL